VIGDLFMTLREALIWLGIDPNIDISKIDEATVRKFYHQQSKKYHPDHNKGDKKAEEKMKRINEAEEIVLKYIRKNLKNSENLRFIADYEYYKARYNSLTDLKHNKYYPKLTKEQYIKMYANIADKKLEIYVKARKKGREINTEQIEKDLNLNTIIERYTTGQENRDSINKHIDLSFDDYLSLYIRYYGLIDLDKWIDEYAKGGREIRKPSWSLFGRNNMNLERYLDSVERKKVL